MKRIGFVLLMVAMAVVSYAGEIKVSGTVTGKNFYQSVSLYYINNDFVTTVPVAPDGKFNLTADIPSAESFYLLFNGENGLKRQLLAVFSPGDKLDITFESTYTELKFSYVNGSSDMALMKRYYDSNSQLQSDLRSIEKEYEKAEAADRPAIQQKAILRYQTFSQELEKMLLSNKTLLSSILIEFAEFSNEYKDHKPTFTTLYTSLQPKYGNTLVVKKVEDMVTNPIEIGKKAPEIEGTTADGEIVKLSDLKGKYVLIDFWASWCRPCRAENPNVVAAYNKYKSKKFDIFSVSLDADETAWKNAIKADGLAWNNHVCSLKRWNCPIARKYHVKSIPFSVLIGPDGKIIATGLRGEALQTKLSELLK